MSDAAASSASLVISSTTVTTVNPVPSSRAGIAANAARRAASPGSLTSTRARSRLPADAAAADADAAASCPSATKAAVIAASGIGENSMRTQREAMVTSSASTWSASTTNTVLAGGSSRVFNNLAAPSAVRRWNSSRIITLRSLSTGASDAVRMISSICSLAIAAPTRRTSRTSGCSPASASRADRWSGWSPPARSAAANARAASSLVEPGGPTNR